MKKQDNRNVFYSCLSNITVDLLFLQGIPIEIRQKQGETALKLFLPCFYIFRWYHVLSFHCNMWITRQLSYQSIWIKAGYRLFSGCIHDTTTVCSLELYSYFYYFRCFQSGYGQFSFYSGYEMIFSQDIICTYGICVIGSVSISVQSSLFPFGRLCISFPHFRWQRTALAGITFFLFYKTDPVSFQLIFQHDVDPVIRQAVELLVCPVSQVFFSPDIPDIPCNDTVHG